MIVQWRAIYKDGSCFIGASTAGIDRSRLSGFEILWGTTLRDQAHFHIEVPDGLRLVYRRRGAVEANSSVTMDHVLVALESKDRAIVKLWVLHCDRGRPEWFEQFGWGGPDRWAPKLKEFER